MAKRTTMHAKRYSRADVFFLIAVPALAILITWLVPINLLAATLLLFCPPAVYISLRRRDIVARSLVYSLAIAVISIFTDYLAERDQSWVSTTMFDFRVAQVVPIEALVWLFGFTYLIVVYYQYFFDHASHKVIGKRLPYVFLGAGLVLAWVGLTAFVDLHFTIDYYYIKFGLAFILIPLIVFCFVFPKYIRPFLMISPYFFAIGLANLIVSLEKGHWAYPGEHFVGWVEIGAYRFPIEELVFWIILYSPFLISQFELFNNDNLKLKDSSIRIRRSGKPKK